MNIVWAVLGSIVYISIGSWAAQFTETYFNAKFLKEGRTRTTIKRGYPTWEQLTVEQKIEFENESKYNRTSVAWKPDSYKVEKPLTVDNTPHGALVWLALFLWPLMLVYVILLQWPAKALVWLSKRAFRGLGWLSHRWHDSASYVARELVDPKQNV